MNVKTSFEKLHLNKQWMHNRDFMKWTTGSFKENKDYSKTMIVIIGIKDKIIVQQNSPPIIFYKNI